MNAIRSIGLTAATLAMLLPAGAWAQPRSAIAPANRAPCPASRGVTRFNPTTYGRGGLVNISPGSAAGGTLTMSGTGGFVHTGTGTVILNPTNAPLNLGTNILLQSTVRPDFIITAISFSPAAVSAEDFLTAYVTVRNQGNAAGDAGCLDVWVAQPLRCGNAVPATAAAGWAPVGTLEAGTSTNIVLTGLPPPTSFLCGFLALVDSRSNTVERSESNNTFLQSYVLASCTNGLVLP